MGRALRVKLEGAGFTRCGNDSCLYFRHQGGNIAIFGVYVDDLIVTASSEKLVELFFEAINCSSIKDLDEARKFLGMRVHIGDLNAYKLDRQASFEEMLQHHGFSEENGVHAHIVEGRTKWRKTLCI